MSRGTNVWGDSCPGGTVVLGGHLSRGTNVGGTNVRGDSCPGGQLSGGTLVGGTDVTPPSYMLLHILVFTMNVIMQHCVNIYSSLKNDCC